MKPRILNRLKLCSTHTHTHTQYFEVEKQASIDSLQLVSKFSF